MPASATASATPAARGASGPTTTSSPETRRATSVTAAGSSASTATQTTPGSWAIAALPGATITWLTPGSAASFQANACSRPPPPTTRIRVGMWRRAALTVGSRGDPRAVAHRAPGALDGLGRLGPDGQQDDRHAGMRLDRAHVAAGVLRQVGERSDAVDGLVPTGEVLEDRRRAGEGDDVARGSDLDRASPVESRRQPHRRIG